MRSLNILVIMLVVCACTPIDVDLAQKCVDRFHSMYEKKEYAEIYAETSSVLKIEATEEQFVSVLTEAENKSLGVFKKATLKSKKKSYYLFSNNEIVLTYISEYTKRNVYEVFVYEIVNGAMKLKGYHYDSIN
ncbi:type IV secretion protein Rhs [Buttiauxella sp. A2-C2_NF]|uniref:type IV secretion protein Rhs n=1 Tax=Buttiauxella ferragutiae TaxID=82989 RepID=UPI001E4B2DE7|nr:type IV secretion protein Rhs [Buttiauxella ferragutiae]MCE0824815.1 type IV secretion protein Rhs [Buttiauxella ferragutiae]